MLLDLYIVSIVINIIFFVYDLFINKEEKNEDNKKTIKEMLTHIKEIYGDIGFNVSIVFILTIYIFFSPAILVHVIYKKICC
jgi:hypothetical protein